MSLVDFVRQVEGSELIDEDGHGSTLELLPPLSEDELRQLAERIPCTIPPDIADLLRVTRGFTSTIDLNFAGIHEDTYLEEIFPHGLSVGHDGFGNYWIVDLTPESTEWGPVFYMCHDPPIVAFQTHSFEHFLREVVKLEIPPHESEINEVHEEFTTSIWIDREAGIPVSQCLNGEDPELRRFAESLAPEAVVFDLRDPKKGDGFAWGRSRHEDLKRDGYRRVFAYIRQRSLFERLFGRS